MAEQVAALDTRITNPGPGAAGHAGIIAAHRAHVANQYRAYVDKVGQIIDATGPRDGDLAVMNAHTSLDLALACTLLAAIQMTPTGRGTAEMLDTARRTHHVIDTLGRLVAAVDSTVAATQERLAMLHTAAGRGEITGPPSSSPTAEVEAVIRELITVTQSVQGARRHLDAAVRRIGRLAYTTPPPTSP